MRVCVRERKGERYKCESLDLHKPPTSNLRGICVSNDEAFSEMLYSAGVVLSCIVTAEFRFAVLICPQAGLDRLSE